MYNGQDNIKRNREELFTVTLKYLPYYSDKPPLTKEIMDVIYHCNSRGRQLIAVCDSNAYLILWVSTDINLRERLVEYLVSLKLDTLNSGNKPNFAISNRKEVIELTLGINHIGNLSRKLHEYDKPTLSDHRYIVFKVRNIQVDKITFCNPKRSDWEPYKDDLTVNLNTFTAKLDHSRSNNYV
jgi:hypothetical protein